MAGYDYSLVYKPGRDNNADGLSRLSLERNSGSQLLYEDELGWANLNVMESDSVDIMMMELDRAPVTAEEVKSWSRQDPVIAKVIDLVLTGWAEGKYSHDLKVFQLRKDELSVLDGCLLWGSRIVIPPEGQNRVLEQLHKCHPGISRMKSLTCSYVWWPGMDSNIEQLINTCVRYQQYQKSTDKAPIHPWEWPTKPWQRLHIDYAGPFHNKMFLL